MNLWNNFVVLFLTAAPWLLFGYLLAALINTLVPQKWFMRHLGDARPSTTIKAALIGAPLPLCSCGVLPAALGLRRAGASKNATTSFLIATPETGVDSIAVSYALLGPVLAIARPIAALFSAITAGLLVGRAEDRNKDKCHTETSCSNAAPTQATSCCSSGHCCSSHEAPRPPSKIQKWRSLFRFALVELVEDTYRWLLLGLIFAAAVQTWLPKEWLIEWGQGFWAMLIMAVIGIPMYICATASTPVAAGFLLAGVSPGAVLVFMLAGPATNIATLALVDKELGRRPLLAYLGGVIGGAFICGALLDWIISHWQLTIQPVMMNEQELLYSVPVIICAVILALAMVNAFINEFRHSGAHDHDSVSES